MYYQPSGGWIELVCGSMFSGKTEELLRRVRRAEIAAEAVARIQTKIDTVTGWTASHHTMGMVATTQLWSQMHEAILSMSLLTPK